MSPKPSPGTPPRFTLSRRSLELSLLTWASLLASRCGLAALVPRGEAEANGSVASRVSRHRFPRLANQVQLCYRSAGTESVFDQLHQWDLCVVDAGMVLEMPDYLGQAGKIRERNPDAVILAYFSAGDVNPNLPKPINLGYLEGLEPSWYLRDGDGEQVRLFEMRPGVWTLAANPTTPLNRYLPAYLSEKVLATGLVDGVFYDWVSTSVSWLNRRLPAPKSRVDIDGRGSPDSDEVTDRKWTAGIASVLANSRRQFPRGTVIAGNGGWNTGDAHLPLLNGIMIERFLAGESQDEKSFGWSAVMRTYSRSVARAVSPKLPVIMANSDDESAVSDLRFALASTLLFDGYFCFTNKDALNGYQSVWWYDEYSVDLETGEAGQGAGRKGYLGSAVSEARDSTGQTLAKALETAEDAPADRFWRRDFENGIALVNPSRQPQHVDLRGRFRRIRGRRDPETNDGQALQNVRLSPRSGLILLRTT